MPATAEDLKIAVQDLGCVIASSRDEKYKQSLRDLQDRLAESARLLEAPADEQLEKLWGEYNTAFEVWNDYADGEPGVTEATIRLNAAQKALEAALRSTPPRETTSDTGREHTWALSVVLAIIPLEQFAEIVKQIPDEDFDRFEAAFESFREMIQERDWKASFARPAPASPASEEELPFTPMDVSGLRKWASIYEPKRGQNDDLVLFLRDLASRLASALTTKKETV